MGLGSKIAELKHKIMLATNELSSIQGPPASGPELINSTKLLLENEYLSSVNKKRTELLEWYKQYATELETTFSMVFEIQKDLKDLIKEHANDISKPRRVRKRPIRKKTSRPKKKPIKRKTIRKKR